MVSDRLPSFLPPMSLALLCHVLLSEGAGGWRTVCPNPSSSLVSFSCLQRSPLPACGEGLQRGLEAIPGPYPKFRQHQLPLWGLGREGRYWDVVPSIQHLLLAMWSSLFSLPSPLTISLPFL